MKKIFLGKKISGFTLIELIIVIAILGILAVAVLSAINPLEQIRKANDSRRKSNAAEFLNGLERYAATSGGTYPTAFDVDDAVPGTLVTPTMVSALGSEFKAEYGSRIAKATDYIYAYTESGGLAHVCYQIESAEQQNKYGTSAGMSTAGGYITCLPE